MTVGNMLSSLVDMSDCYVSPAKRRKLSERARFSIGVVNYLLAADSIQASKQAILDNGIDCMTENVKAALWSGVRTILESDQTGEAARLFVAWS